MQKSPIFEHSMKAIILNSIDQPVSFTTTDSPTLLDSNQVLVQLNYAALNHRDVWIQKGQYAGIKLPAILGSDGCGTVVEVGSLENEYLINKKVIINAGLHWGTNQACQSKEFSIIGMPSQGTFAEYISVDVKQIYDKPSHLADAEASALPLAGLTAFRAMFSQGQVLSTQKILLTGIGGGVSQWAFQFALANKNEVWVTSGDDLKLSRSIDMGAAGGINYKNDDWGKTLIKQSSDFDLIIDSACGDDFNKLIDLCKPGGKIVIYGGTTGNINQVIPAKVFWKQISIIGSTMGSDADFKEMIDFVNEHQVKPVQLTIFEMAETENALRLMEEGKQFGKIVLKIAT